MPVDPETTTFLGAVSTLTFALAVILFMAAARLIGRACGRATEMFWYGLLAVILLGLAALALATALVASVAAAR